jgi:hypothetical protein
MPDVPAAERPKTQDSSLPDTSRQQESATGFGGRENYQNDPGQGVMSEGRVAGKAFREDSVPRTKDWSRGTAPSLEQRLADFLVTEAYNKRRVRQVVLLRNTRHVGGNHVAPLLMDSSRLDMHCGLPTNLHCEVADFQNAHSSGVHKNSGEENI